MMTLNRFATRGKRTTAATRQVLKDVYKDLAPAAQKALLSSEMDYHIRYQFDSSALGTGCVLPTLPGTWRSTGFRDMGYYERENWNWKPLRLVSQGFRKVAVVSTDTYRTTGYSKHSYARLGVERLTKEWQGMGFEVYIRPCNYERWFVHSVPGVHGCWGDSNEEFQVWVRRNERVIDARLAG